jgi:hypothetical protein
MLGRCRAIQEGWALQRTGLGRHSRRIREAFEDRIREAFEDRIREAFEDRSREAFEERRSRSDKD